MNTDGNGTKWRFAHRVQADYIVRHFGNSLRLGRNYGENEQEETEKTEMNGCAPSQSTVARRAEKPLKTVCCARHRTFTPLKRGVNETSTRQNISRGIPSGGRHCATQAPVLVSIRVLKHTATFNAPLRGANYPRSLKSLPQARGEMKFMKTGVQMNCGGLA